MTGQVIEFDAIDHVDPSRQGGRRRGEVWGPGPLEGTWWVLDPDGEGLPHRGARVVLSQDRREVAWSTPAPVAAAVTCAVSTELTLF